MKKDSFDSIYWDFRSAGGPQTRSAGGPHPSYQSPWKNTANENLKGHATKVLHILYVVTNIQWAIALGLLVEL